MYSSLITRNSLSPNIILTLPSVLIARRRAREPVNGRIHGPTEYLFKPEEALCHQTNRKTVWVG